MVRPRHHRVGSPRRWAVTAAALTLVSALVVVGSPTTTVAAEGSWDAYGGWTGRALAATGAFRTEDVDGRWWLVTPDGHPFFSNGLNSVRPTGTIDRNGNAAYRDTILAKYGTETAWADAQLSRFDTWGVNTIAGWSDVSWFAGRMPYTVSLSLAEHDVATGRTADFWSPTWLDAVEAATTAAAAGRTDDPWLIGYFLDNELHWTRDFRLLDQLDYYAERDATAPGKQHLVTWLEDRYRGDFSAFAADFTTDATTWANLADASGLADRGAGAAATRDAWSAEVAERYFAVTDAALSAADPNHLNLGTRFFGQLILPGVLDAASRYVDVISVNWYELTPEAERIAAEVGPTFLPTADTLAAHRARADKPFLISEFGWRATDSGLPNTWPPLQVVVDTQPDRADRYRNFAQCLANTGQVVGAHWFGLVDQPAIGRADGENSNWGFVTEADDPYGPLTEAAAEVRDLSYAPATDPAWAPGPCTPMGPQPAVADPTPPPLARPMATVVVPAFTG